MTWVTKFLLSLIHGGEWGTNTDILQEFLQGMTACEHPECDITNIYIIRIIKNTTKTDLSWLKTKLLTSFSFTPNAL